MYVHGCANPIKYLYLQGHFSKRDFREMSFLLWSNDIKMKEGIMTNITLRAGGAERQSGVLRSKTIKKTSAGNRSLKKGEGYVSC